MNLNALTLLQPTLSELASLFSGLSIVPQKILNGLLLAMDPSLVEKLAAWAETFIAKADGIQVPATSEQSPPANFSGNFGDTMGSVQQTGHKLTQAELSEAHKAVTEAIKSQNFVQGVQVGVSLAGLMR
jgi:hypothetical protein